MAGPLALVPLLVMVGGTAFKVANSKAAKVLLNRFKGARLVEKPTPAQVNSATTLSKYQQKDLSFFSKPQLDKLIKADSKEVTIPQALTGRGYRNPADPKIPASGERARKNIKNVAGGVGAGATVGGGIGAVAGDVKAYVGKVINKFRDMQDRTAMKQKISETLRKDGLTGRQIKEVLAENEDFLRGRESEGKVKLTPKDEPKNMNKGGSAPIPRKKPRSVPTPRKKPHSPIYTREVYKKFKKETEGMSQEATDAYIARRGRNKGGTVMKKKPVKKLAKGGFPDLSGDGKVTKKDVLMGSGVKMNMGGMKKVKSTYNMGGMKKQYGAKNYMYGGSVMGKKKK